MKKIFVNGFTVLALLFSLANCGKSGSGSNNNNPNTYYPYNPNYTTPVQYNQQYQQMYGTGYNYCNTYQQGCISCYYPQCNQGYGGGCNWNQVYYYQPGYYPGQYQNGGAFSMAFAW